MSNKKYSKIDFVFPENNNLQEKPPELMYTEFYGLIDGYGLMFDPTVMALTRIIPDIANGFPEQPKRDTIFISGSSLTAIPDGDFTGLLVKAGGKCSRKELLQCGNIKTTYPAGLGYVVYPDSTQPNLTLNGVPVLRRNGRAFELGIELFNMLDRFRGDQPEKGSLMVADILAALFSETFFPKLSASPVISEGFRLDCQSYGVNRFLINWLAELFLGTADFSQADTFYKMSIGYVLNEDMDSAEKQLGMAFQTLAEIRKGYSKTNIKFIEIPHIGILFEDEGFFEFEWPEFTRMRIEKLLDFTENTESKVAFEVGTSCWKNFARLFPETINRLNKLKTAGKTSVTNGTFSLPYALYSPVGIQYWQFENGMREYQNLFGNSSPTYQCQENSFTPLMPQLFKHFGINSALHVIQNRGKSPIVKEQFFKWRGADGSTCPAMGVPDEALGRKGSNYFYDLPQLLKKYSHLNEIYYPNFQDIGFVPFRTHIYRSSSYASIWGDFMLPEELPYEEGKDECFFQPEDYGLAEAEFYQKPTCINSLSQLERIYRQYGKLRQLQFAAWDSGKLKEVFPALNSLVPELLLQEAHDIVACQGQKIGDFYKSNALLESPVKETCLYQKAHMLNDDFELKSSEIAKLISPDKALPERDYSYDDFKIENDNNKLRIELCGKSFTIAVFDRKRGDFEVTNVSYKAKQIVVAVCLKENGKILHQANLTFGYFANASLLELTVDYASSAEFSYKNKWQDYLGISIELDNGLGKLTHCTPGYRTEAHKPLIISSYFLSLSAGLSLLNEGTPYYEKLSDSVISWMFHNYGESVHHRRMAIYLGEEDPMPIATSWNCGFVKTSLKLPEDFIAEIFIDPNKVLAVSVRDTDITNLPNIEILGYNENPNKINAGTLAIFNLEPSTRE